MEASACRVKCLQLIDEPAACDEEAVISGQGRPGDRKAAHGKKPKTLFGIDRGRLQITGDIISGTDSDWEADSDPDPVINP